MKAFRFIMVGTMFFALALALPAPAQIVTNGSFELPVIPSFDNGIYGGGNGVPGWTFNNAASGGLTEPGSGYDNFNILYPPDGAQFAYLQNTLSSMWQTITLPTNLTGTYTLSYWHAGRRSAGYGGNVTYNVLLDSTILLTTNTVSDSHFTSVIIPFNAAPGTHLLTFTNAPTVPLDNSDFFDAVQIINGTPPPQFVTNGSFELPDIVHDNGSNYEYAAAPEFNNNGWTYSAGGSGVIASLYQPPAFNNVTVAPVNSNQFAFLQNSSAAVWQTITLPTNGTYNLTYYFAGRPFGHSQLQGNSFGGNATSLVLVDSTIVATNTTTNSQPFTFNSVFFTTNAGSHVLMFSNSAALVTNDQTMLLDYVQVIQATPLTATAYAGLQLHGTPGSNYTVGFAGALPASSWTPLTNVMLTTNALTCFDVTSAGVPGRRFYDCTGIAPAQPASLAIGLYTGYNIPQGVAGKNYALQFLDALPVTTWTTITNGTLPSSAFIWLDPAFVGRPNHRYYRAVVLP